MGVQDNGLSFEAVIFDLDGVITKTALVHGLAWKAMFDEFLQKKAQEDGPPYKEFTHEKDYLPFVDGKPRYDGVKSFLESRQINIPFGSKDDDHTEETVCGLGNRKNIKFREILDSDGIQVYKSTVDLIYALKEKNIHVGVASSSKNCQYVLQVVDLESQFETRVDGVVSAEIGLNGKPAPDIFIKAAENMGCEPSRSIVVEDASSGVKAGCNGGFGLVIGLAREDNEDDLKAHGADIVLKDFEGFGIKEVEEWFCKKNK
jgi:beta-phosphoglucomutase family hydrolase